MKRVFHIITHFDLGGAERVAANIAKSPSADVDYHVVEVLRSRTPYARDFAEELKRNGIAIHRFVMPEVRFHYLFERLAAFVFPFWFIFVCLRWRPDVIHCHTEVPELATWWLFRLFPFMGRKCRVVRTIHNTKQWNGMQWSARRVEPWVQKQHANVAISEAVSKHYTGRFGVAPTHLIYNGVEECAPQPFDGIVSGKFNVLFAGRLEPQKGIGTLIAVVESMAADDRYRFHIVGNGSLETLVRQHLGRLPHVKLYDTLPHLAAKLHCFDLLLMPSEFEGLGLLSAEASLAGALPVINACEGLRETVPADWPLQVQDNSVEAFIDLFSRVIPAADRDALARRALGFARKRFSLSSMQRQYEHLYLS